MCSMLHYNHVILYIYIYIIYIKKLQQLSHAFSFKVDDHIRSSPLQAVC